MGRSPTCRDCFRGEWEAHPVSTNLVERLHPEVAHVAVRIAPGRNVASLVREALFKQSAAEHVNSGGNHPLRPLPLSDKVRREEHEDTPAPLCDMPPFSTRLDSSSSADSHSEMPPIS